MFDWLKERENGSEIRRYSQGRVYLFVSFIVFLILNLVVLFYALSGIQFDRNTIELVASNLKWALGTFALYTLGGKGIEAAKRERNN